MSVLDVLTWGIIVSWIGMPLCEFLLCRRRADGSVIPVPVGIENERQ